MFIVLGNRRIAPSKSVISWKPVALGAPIGTEVRGSGNWGTPCWRMHRAILTSLASVWAEGCVLEPGPGGPPPRNFRHLAWAALNAGAAALAPAGMAKSAPLPGFGSGKSGTPLARIHLAKASGLEVVAPPGAGT